ncbi:hypothetical protein O3P69_012929 [Scylla paramamosain]|uniref:Uncharacterized protein n=1 Tax=Scylla paramamosain TaxID=85552 RepID=A0AAW0TSM8_SCYPA
MTGERGVAVPSRSSSSSSSPRFATHSLPLSTTQDHIALPYDGCLDTRASTILQSCGLTGAPAHDIHTLLMTSTLLPSLSRGPTSPCRLSQAPGVPWGRLGLTGVAGGRQERGYIQKGNPQPGHSTAQHSHVPQACHDLTEPQIRGRGQGEVREGLGGWGYLSHILISDTHIHTIRFPGPHTPHRHPGPAPPVTHPNADRGEGWGEAGRGGGKA